MSRSTRHVSRDCVTCHDSYLFTFKRLTYTTILVTLSWSGPDRALKRATLQDDVAIGSVSVRPSVCLSVTRSD